MNKDIEQRGQLFLMKTGVSVFTWMSRQPILASVYPFMDGTFVSPSNSYFEALTSHDDGLGGTALERSRVR